MYKSVLAAVFACAVFVVSKPHSASATPLMLEDEQPPLKSLAAEKALALAEVVGTVSDSETTDSTKTSETATTAEPQAVAPQVHSVAEGESLSTIAEIHGTTWRRLYDKNSSITDPDMLVVGAEIVVPDQAEVLEERELPQVVVRQAVKSASRPTNPSVAVQVASAPRGSSDGNRYAAGYCTWYIKNKRPDLPNNLGNAATWVSRAAAQGIPTGSTPQVGAVGQRSNHVVYVEAINGDGTITISDMNYRALYEVTVRTVSASDFRYIY